MSLPMVIFITALPCEFKAVADYLNSPQEEQHPQGTIYHRGEYPAENPRWRVAVAETGQTNSVAAFETGRAVDYFQPEYVFFVGIAGGIKDVELGDVVVAETAKGYERGKVTDTGILPRGEVGKSDYRLVERAKAIAKSGDWCASLQREKIPNVIVPATIAAGEKVIDSTRHAVYQFLIENYSEAVAVEMEGIGFLEAVRRCSAHGIVIRGISDKLAKDSQHDKQWQPVAAQNAAAFAFAMLDKLTPPNEKTHHSATSPKINNVWLPRNRFFTGRNETLGKLHRFLTQDQSVALYSVALNGIGGVGKTQTALEYAYRYQSEYETILWISGDGKDALESHFANLYQVLGLPRLDKQEDTIAMVRNWLNTHYNWLLIVDNAETAEELRAAAALIPATRGRRLFTTRTQAVGEMAVPIEIDCLEEMTGGILLVRRARLVDWQLAMEDVPRQLRDQDWQTAQEISSEFEGLPLALDQAGAYIEQTSLSLSDYLCRYREYTPQMLQFESKGQYPTSVYVTFQMALEKVEQRSPLAGEVLRMCAFLHPDGIPTKLLNSLSDNLLSLDDAMRTLNDYSLVKRGVKRDVNVLTVHRIVQQVVKEVCDE